MGNANNVAESVQLLFAPSISGDVRRFIENFAIQFVEPQNPARLEDLIIRP